MPGLGTWTFDCIPESALIQFGYPADETSVWDETIDASHRTLVALALALERTGISKLSFASLWTRDLGPDVRQQFAQTDGNTPVGAANVLHYELAPRRDEPAYRAIAYAASCRHELTSLSPKEVLDVIEDGYLQGLFAIDQLVSPRLRTELERAFERRLIHPKRLKEFYEHHIFDVRATDSPEKIKNARWANRSEIEKKAALPQGIAKTDEVTLYCENGQASIRLARLLRTNNYKTIRVLIGGYASWVAAGS